MDALKRSVLNVYMSIPRELETDWISLMRQFGFLNAECQVRGISMNLCKGWQKGFHWKELSADGPCVCVSLMEAEDFTEDEQAAATDLLKREGVACVIALLKSESAGNAWYEIDRSALCILHYSEPSDIRIVELPAVQKLLSTLAPGEECDEDGRVSEIHPGLIVGRGPDPFETLQTNPDVIVALDSLPGDVWEQDFRGEILYYPIRPYGVLPFFILERLVVEVAARLEDRQRVALYCGEDCGRLGYVASCVLFQCGVREPIDHLRRNWDASALSVELQESDVRLFCYRHVARSYWNCVQLSRHIQIDSIDTFKADEDIRRATHQIRETLGGKGRISFRFSGLLPSVRILVEAPDMQQCERVMDEFINAVKRSGHYEGMVYGW